MTVQIIEVIDRSKQGVTQPFICRGDDGNIYFVKGNSAGRRSQVCEWICGNLALELKLPIAPFCIVDVPEELLEGNPFLSELGIGPAFASQKQMIMELNYAGIDHIPEQLQRLVLAFDWWIKNEDRMLSASGGNPNLFWEPEQERLVVIDHNQAFDRAFSSHDFLKNHVFSGQAHQLFDDVLYKKEYVEKFMAALKSWQKICDSIPEEWNFVDSEQTVESDFDLCDILNTLERCKTEAFWSE